MNKGVILLIAVILISACAGEEKDIEFKIKYNKDVSDFYKTYPNASLRIELVNNITAPSLYQEILDVCPDVVERTRYWKVTLFHNSTNTTSTVWTKDDGKSVCRLTVEGKVEVVETKTETTNTYEITTTTVNNTTATTADNSGSWGGGGGGGGSGGGGSPPPANVPKGPNLAATIDSISYDSSKLDVSYSIKNAGTEFINNTPYSATITNYTGAFGTINPPNTTGHLWFSCGNSTNFTVGQSISDRCAFTTDFGYSFGKTYQVIVEADVLNNITETDENDNSVSRILDTSVTTTTSPPAATTTTFTPNATFPPGTTYQTTTTSSSFVDLSASIASSSVNGLAISVTWEVKNLGTSTSGPFQISVDFVNQTGSLVSTCPPSSFDSVTPNYIVSATCSRTMSTDGTYTAKVIINGGNDANINNNIASQSFTVSSSPGGGFLIVVNNIFSWLAYIFK